MGARTSQCFKNRGGAIEEAPQSLPILPKASEEPQVANVPVSADTNEIAEPELEPNAKTSPRPEAASQPQLVVDALAAAVPAADSLARPSTAKSCPNLQASEKRVDPLDGRTYTFEQLAAFYKGSHQPQQIQAYWDTECKTIKKKKMVYGRQKTR